MYRFILHPGQLAPPPPPPGVQLPLGSLSTGGEDTPGILPLTLGSLAPGGKAASGQLAPQGWRYSGLGSLPPPPENLTELNAERLYFFLK